MIEEQQAEIVNYRDCKVEVYYDTFGQSRYIIFNGKEINLGSFNDNYIEDVKYIIDDYLDTITRFEEDDFYWGSLLEFFDNGGYRDIRLSYRKRIIKIFNIVNNKYNIDEIIEEAKKILNSTIPIFKAL